MAASIRILSLTLAAAATSATVMSAQVRRSPAGQQQPPVKIDVSLQVGSNRYMNASGGRCEYAPVASIYTIVSEMYRVEQQTDSGSVTLTFWKPKDGSAAMMNLSVSAAGAIQDVQTVKGAPPKGSGTIVVEKAGRGGTFKIDARSATATAIRGTITCSAFTPAVAEGGE